MRHVPQQGVELLVECTAGGCWRGRADTWGTDKEGSGTRGQAFNPSHIAPSQMPSQVSLW